MQDLSFTTFHVALNKSNPTLPYYFFKASRGRLFNYDSQSLEAFLE